MPSAGFSHFYVNNSMTFPLRKVSMPSAGFSHFYVCKQKYGYSMAWLCQCPRRAFLISTVPSGNPHKYGAPRLIFACICPNILKTTVFQDIFVLFIICSYFHWIFSPCLLYNSSFADKSIFCSGRKYITYIVRI